MKPNCNTCIHKGEKTHIPNPRVAYGIVYEICTIQGNKKIEDAYDYYVCKKLYKKKYC